MILNLPTRLSTRLLILATAFTALTGCNNVSPNRQNTSVPATVIPSTMQPATKIQADISPAMQMVNGDYATEDYNKRAQGYDWTGVMIRAIDNQSIDIKVRSRSDIKKPTCSFDGTATLVGQDNAHGVIFKTEANDSVTFLQFKDGKLTIDAQYKYALNAFCSGGATLAGDYQKLAGNLELR
ncbi:MAG: hypothetical protein L0G25_04235 [Psychrobacter sp.]|nr:hypothetical protein [Psychrobacter sp.]